MMPLLLHYALALFFLWLLAAAAWHKLRHPDYYRSLLPGFLPGVSVAKTPLPVYFIAGLEGLLAVSLAVAPLRPAAFLAVAVLLFVYLLALGRRLANGDSDSRCGCAGPESDLRISPALILRNGILVLLALAGAIPVLPASAGVGLTLTGVLMGVFLIAVYLCTEQLLLNAQRFRASWG